MCCVLSCVWPLLLRIRGEIHLCVGVVVDASFFLLCHCVDGPWCISLFCCSWLIQTLLNGAALWLFSQMFSGDHMSIFWSDIIRYTVCFSSEVGFKGITLACCVKNRLKMSEINTKKPGRRLTGWPRYKGCLDRNGSSLVVERWLTSALF